MAVSSFLVAAPVVTAAYDAEYLAAFDWAKDSGLTSMSDADAFGPYRNLTRQEWSKFIGTFGEDFLCLEENPEAQCDFADAAQVSPYLADSVEKACMLGLMRGSNGSFYPNTFVSKAQVLATLVRGMEDYMDESTSPWYANYHSYALDNGITTVSDVNSFDRPVSRYEALLMLYRARDYECDFEVVVTTGTTNTGVVNPTGTATISLSPDTPRGGSNNEINIAGSSNNNKVMKIDVIGNDGTTQLQSINFMIDGLFNRANIVGLSLADENGVRVTNVRTLNSSNEANLTFTTPTSLAAGEKKSFRILLNVSGSVNERFTVEAKNGASVNGILSVNAPVISAPIRTTQVGTQNITYTSNNASANVGVCPSAGSLVYIGDTNKLIGRFSLSVSSTNNRNVMVDSIRLKSTQNIQGVVNDITLEVGTGTVPATAYINGKYVTIVFTNGYMIPYGNIRTFYVKGDIVGGDANDKIELYLEDSSDLMAHEDSTAMLALNSTMSTPYSNLYCIKEGLNQISRTDTISNMNVPTRESLVFGLQANVNTKSAVNVDKVRVYVQDNGNISPSFNPAMDIENVRLFVNGILVDTTSTVMCPGVTYNGTTPYAVTPASLLAPTACYYEFNYYNQLNGGANAMEVRFDTKSTAVQGHRISFLIDPTSIAFGGNAEYVATQNTVTAAEINGTAQGTDLIITNPAVDNISRTDNFINGVVMVKESADFTAIKFAVRANNVRDLVLNGFNLGLVFNPVASNAGFVGDAMIYVDGALVQTQNFANTLAASFNSLGIIIPKGSQKEVTIKVRTYSNHPDTIAGVAGDVRYTVSAFDVDDINGNAVTVATTLNGANIDVAPGIVVQCNNINPIASTIIPASTTVSVPVANFEFRSQYGASVITELAIANVNTAGATVATPTLAANYNATPTASIYIDYSADGMILEVYNGTTMVGQGQLINGVAYIVLTTPINLPQNSSVVLSVRAKSSNPITNIGTRTLQTRLLDPNVAVTALGGGTAQTQVSAAGSTASVTANCTNQSANAHSVRATKISLTDVANPNQTTINSLVGVLGTSQTIFKTKITADAAGSAKLYSVNFKIDGKLAGAALAAGTISNFKLRVNGTLIAVADMTCTPTYGSPTNVACTFMGGYPNGYSIAAWSTIDVDLVADVNAALVAGDYLSTSILEGTSNITTPFVAGIARPGVTVVWTDNANNGNTVTADLNWYSDRGVEVLPTNSWTFSKQ